MNLKKFIKKISNFWAEKKVQKSPKCPKKRPKYAVKKLK